MDTVSAKTRSRIMASVRSAGNKSTELTFISSLKAAKITGWRRNFPIPGKPDFVFPKFRIAVFIDGCFWHGCQKHCRIPTTNKTYWQNKIEQNRMRDKIITDELTKANWKVLRFWEHDVRNLKSIRRLESAFAHPPLRR